MGNILCEKDDKDDTVKGKEEENLAGHKLTRMESLTRNSVMTHNPLERKAEAPRSEKKTVINGVLIVIGKHVHGKLCRKGVE
jgi:hypothetical protein